MARPTKYLTGQDKIEAAQPTRNLVKEIKSNSGLTYAAMSAALNAYPLQPLRLVISEALLRQYAIGQKPMGERRMAGVAMVALSLGWLSVENYWAYDAGYDLAVRQAHRLDEQSDVHRKHKLFLAIKSFADAGYDIEEVQDAVFDTYQKLAHEFEVNPPREQMLER
jgi:hypothetical protein